MAREIFNLKHPTIRCEVVDEGETYYVVRPKDPDTERFIGGFLVAVVKWEWKPVHADDICHL